jgi:hypothetical protein
MHKVENPRKSIHGGRMNYIQVYFHHVTDERKRVWEKTVNVLLSVN